MRTEGSRKENDRLSIRDLMIEPVQRLPRIILLLGKLKYSVLFYLLHLLTRGDGKVVERLKVISHSSTNKIIATFRTKVGLTSSIKVLCLE